MAGPAATTPGPTASIRPVVLVVDDDPAVLAALRALLAPRLEPLFAVETASSAEEALQLCADMSAESSPLAVVISDERMPGRQGTDLLVALRQSPVHRHGGRIIVTAYAGLESVKRAINDAQVVRYYPKPWDDDAQLLPAIGEILERFLSCSGLDGFLLAEPVTWESAGETILALRQAWWECLHLYGMSAHELEVVPPDFGDSEDSLARHVIAWRQSPKGRTAAASARLVPRGAGKWELSRVALSPNEADEPCETLLLRTAIAEAESAEAKSLHATVPWLRRPIYEAVGFTPVVASPEPQPEVPMTAALIARPSERVGAFALRFARERRLCACAQRSCPQQDYASERRGYWCPLDALEHRLPPGFPSGGAR